MAAPLVKGRALVRRRLSGVAFIVVIGLLVMLSVALYNKSFTKTVDVALETDRVGNQLTVHADVKLRGIVVGEVRKVQSRDGQAVLSLALKPDQAKLIPDNVEARLYPKTLFGEKEVNLVIPDAASSDHLRDGDRISQDRSQTALETETALNDLLPLLQSLKPQELSATLGALSTALRDRGDKLGANLAQQAAYLKQLNPSLPTLQEDFAGFADLAGSYADATPDLLRTLDNLSYSSRAAVEEKANLDAFLQSTTAFAASAESITRANEQRFVDLARTSRPVLDLYAKYSPLYTCFLGSLIELEKRIEVTEGGPQSGLHITVEAIKDRDGGFGPGDEPQYKETRDNECFGLRGKAVVPYPNFANPQDGYRDSDPAEQPGQGPGGCCQRKGSWMAQMMSPPKVVVASQDMPAGSTALTALLLTPV